MTSHETTYQFLLKDEQRSKERHTEGGETIRQDPSGRCDYQGLKVKTEELSPQKVRSRPNGEGLNLGPVSELSHSTLPESGVE